MLKNVFFWNNSKNIDIWILRKEQTLFRSELYMCVQSSVKIDREMPVKNPRWPPRNLVFLSFQHHTAHHRDRLVLFKSYHISFCILEGGEFRIFSWLPCNIYTIQALSADITTYTFTSFKLLSYWNVSWFCKIIIRLAFSICTVVYISRLRRDVYVGY